VVLLGKLFANPVLAPEDRPWRRSLIKAAMHTYREPDTWRGAIRGITHMLIVPQGFTLSVTGRPSGVLGHAALQTRCAWPGGAADTHLQRTEEK
jgi:hypothetical protein